MAAVPSSPDIEPLKTSVSRLIIEARSPELKPAFVQSGWFGPCCALPYVDSGDRNRKLEHRYYQRRSVIRDRAANLMEGDGLSVVAYSSALEFVEIFSRAKAASLSIERAGNV